VGGGVRRPLRERVWFWRPEWYWFGWQTLLPFYKGGDEWDWHTIVLGWTITGRVIIATRRCPQTGKCAGTELGPDWPADPYSDFDDDRPPHVMIRHGRIAMHSEACWCRDERGANDRRWVGEHHSECAECRAAQ
jgi:hypothetical protein